MEINYITDIDLLIKSRLDYFANDAHMPKENEEIVITSLRSYFEKHLHKDDFIALSVVENDEIVAVGFMVINEMPANGFAPTGRTGTLLNILTYAPYRGKGYGKALIAAIIEEARKRELAFLDLYATEQGEKLYKKFGFASLAYEAMRLKL